MAAKVDELRVHDTRTSKDYEIKIDNNTINASDIAAISIAGRDSPSSSTVKQGTGLRIYDPGYHNVAVAKSNITYTFVPLLASPMYTK